MPQSMVYANERGRALPRSPSEELRGLRIGGGGRCVAYAAAGPEWREGQRHKERCTARESPRSLPSICRARPTVIFCLDRTPRGGKIHRGPTELGQVFLSRYPGAVGERRAGIALHRSRSPLLLLYRSYIHIWRCRVTDEGGTPRPSYVTYDIITVGRPQAFAAHPRTPYAFLPPSLPRSLGGCQQCQVASANQHDMNSNLAPPSLRRDASETQTRSLLDLGGASDPAPTRGSNTARC